MTFLDTNILVYAYDKEERTKHEKAKNIVTKCWNDRSGSLSTQVLQEFYVTVTRKLPGKLSINETREIIQDFLSWQVHQITSANILSASEIEEKLGYSFWDSLIITAAQSLGAEVLYSEDLQDGQKIGNLTIVNPFK